MKQDSNFVYLPTFREYTTLPMQTAKIFQNVRYQAVRLPKEYQVKGNEVYIQKHGDAVLLFPPEKIGELFVEGINEFSDDFMSTGRESL
ncbi:antitoxin [Sediminispirochaeta smaragdinae]|nr:AbrB/MazE/SpoVT family DNA-binding domain-containing protein [Sediminispirochaeta smaragdinae]